eukprot:CAMPEP_0202713756 /NCGR_PEP_ID=MMETSP1385-20130828/59119_1 /ASSEMBLY_ACC=CAM_ASM_000861 /TAXON_ID=933848 /ORGANISM="Elphidium margaritaceum" /LENGTH=94 /DNA_ID=CAMNT_0049374223 /DNA_START=134 /DNA_END=415 /DNA_ORIENTATION=-
MTHDNPTTQTLRSESVLRLVDDIIARFTQERTITKSVAMVQQDDDQIKQVETKMALRDDDGDDASDYEEHECDYDSHSEIDDNDCDDDDDDENE